MNTSVNPRVRAPDRSAAIQSKDDPLQPPLVDVIVPAGTAQDTVLKDYDIQAKRPVRLDSGIASSLA